MAIELHVIFRGKPPNKPALQRELRRLEFPFSLKPATGSLEKQSGYMPMAFRGDETGVELILSSDPETILELLGESADPPFERIASFRWGGDEMEMMAGYCGAAALVNLTGGIVFDEETGEILSPAEVLQAAKTNLGAIMKTSSAKQRGTRPNDIKYYLRPLLEQRSDLALIGRMAIVRPVRHILRGAFLDRTSDKYSFNIHPFIKPLFSHPAGLGYGDPLLGLWRVYEPTFRHHLLDALETEIFEKAASIRSFDDLAAFVERTDRRRRPSPHILAAAGRHEEAIALLGPHASPEKRAWFERDIGAICADLHAWEKNSAKELGLDVVWEPSPFPAELDKGERGSCDEPAFSMTPWPERPTHLICDPAREKLDLVYGEDIITRRGEKVVLNVLRAEEAKRRYRDFEDCAFAARLESGRFIYLRHWTSWSLHGPNRVNKAPVNESRSLQLHVPEAKLIIDLHADRDAADFLSIRSIDLDRDSNHSLHLHYDFRGGEISIHDWRSGKRVHVRRPLTEAELATGRFPAPPFGDADELTHRVSAFLTCVGIDPI